MLLKTRWKDDTIQMCYRDNAILLTVKEAFPFRKLQTIVKCLQVILIIDVFHVQPTIFQWHGYFGSFCIWFWNSACKLVWILHKVMCCWFDVVHSLKKKSEFNKSLNLKTFTNLKLCFMPNVHRTLILHILNLLKC